VSIIGGQLSASQLEEEFKDLVDEDWNWQVQKLNNSDFLMIFPSKESLRMAIRGGGLTRTSNKVQASVAASSGDPLAVEQLVDVKVLLLGIPPPFCNPERLLLGTRELGCPIVVDEDSLEKPLEPIHLYLGCRAPVSLPPHIMLFVNMQGYKVRVVVEADLPGSSVPPPPPNPMDDKEDELEDSDEEDWDGRMGKHDQKKEKRCNLRLLKGNQVELSRKRQP
jgi:hypothetical protein